MRTNEKKFEQASGLKLLAKSSVWNFRGVDLRSVAFSKKSNLNKSLNSLKSSGITGIVTLYVDQIGRSQHNESSVSIFLGETSVDVVGTSIYYGKRFVEINLDLI